MRHPALRRRGAAVLAIRVRGEIGRLRGGRRVLASEHGLRPWRSGLWPGDWLGSAVRFGRRPAQLVALPRGGRELLALWSLRLLRRPRTLSSPLTVRLCCACGWLGVGLRVLARGW